MERQIQSFQKKTRDAIDQTLKFLEVAEYMMVGDNTSDSGNLIHYFYTNRTHY